MPKRSLVQCELQRLESPYQSTARPFGLNLISSVQLAGSDARSQDFQTNDLPGISTYVNRTLGERSAIDSKLNELGSGQAELAESKRCARVFCWRRRWLSQYSGLSTDGQQITDDAGLLFPDASTGSSRSSRTPVLAGDYVDAGSYEAGTQLDFFLVANGANGGRSTWWAGDSTNADGINHVVAFGGALDSPHLIIGFEDLYGGGDNDFNDPVFAVDIGVENVAALVAGNEPATIVLIIAGALAYAFYRRRKVVISCA